MSNQSLDIEAMDNLILEVTHNGGQCSQEFDNWSDRHRKNWSAIKAEVESLRARVKKLESNFICHSIGVVPPPVEPTKGDEV
jgi:archaellum component FlaC